MPEHFFKAPLVLVLLAALVPPGAGADIYLRDEGEGGIALSDLPGDGARRVLAEGPGTVPAIPLAPAGKRPLGRRAAREGLAPLVAAAAAAHGLPENLLAAVIEVESNFNPAALSPKGAQGLMQLMPQTARQLKVADPWDPAANIDAGARYLKELLETFGNDLHLAVAAYNAGPGAVRRKGAIPPYAETRRYVPEVIRRYHSLESGAPARP